MGRDRVSARILCRCGHQWDLCAPVGVPVPESLRCRPTGVPIVSNSRSDICCPMCRRTLFLTDSKLQACIEDRLREARERHVHAGTVVVDLR